MDGTTLALVYLGLCGAVMVAIGVAYAYWPQRPDRHLPPAE